VVRAPEFGDVTNVTLYDLKEQGIVTVRFRKHESADKFRDQKFESMIPDSRFKYHKGGKGDDVVSTPEDSTSTPEDATSRE
jgi:hypothetical protein